LSTAKILWIIISICGTLTLCISLFLPHETALAISPTCNSIKQLGKECFMCGSTRTFLHLSSGHFKEGIVMNRIATVLYIITIINTTIFTITTLKKQNETGKLNYWNH
jgi:hypothetical protein